MAGLGLQLYYSSEEDIPGGAAARSDPPTEIPTEDSPAETPAEDPLAADQSTYITLPLPPLDCHYTSVEQALEAINNFALDHGYAVVKRRSKMTKSKNNPVLKKVWLKCDRGGIYRPRVADGDRKRKTSTILVNCPFNLILRL